MRKLRVTISIEDDVSIGTGLLAAIDLLVQESAVIAENSDTSKRVSKTTYSAGVRMSATWINSGSDEANHG